MARVPRGAIAIALLAVALGAAVALSRRGARPDADFAAGDSPGPDSAGAVVPRLASGRGVGGATETGVVAGRVLDPDGGPVGGAVVTLRIRGDEAASTTADPAGRYRFEGVPWESPREGPGVEVSAVAPGWAYGRTLAYAPSAAAPVRTDVALRRPCRVEGRVRDEREEAIAGARVSLEEAGPWTPPVTFAAVADEQGAYVLEGVPDGAEVLLGAAANGLETSRSLRIACGSNEAEVLILIETRGRTTVRVVDAKGAPVPGVRLEVYVAAPVAEPLRTAETSALGVAEFAGLPLSRATLLARAPAAAVETRVLEADDLRGGEVRIALGPEWVSGRVVDGDGAPSRVPLVLRCRAGEAMAEGLACTPDADGVFRFAHLPLGEYQLLSADSAWSLVPETRLYGDEPDVRVTVLPDETYGRHVLRLHFVDDRTGEPVRKDGRYHVLFRDVGGGPPRTHVEEWWLGFRERWSWRLVCPPLPAGVYDVTATVGGWRSVALPRLRVPMDEPEMTVRLRRGLRLEGSVRLPDGTPCGDVQVHVGSQAASSGDDGMFRVDGLESGPVEARWFGDLVLPETRTVDVRPAGTTSVEWTVRPAGAVAADFARPSRRNGITALRVAPATGGGGRWREDDDPGCVRILMGGLAPGRYHVEARQPEQEWPAQEIEVRAREVTTVRFPANPANR